MNMHLLRLFHAVAGAGGFSRAAERLHISQPAVSKGVRELEAQLGAPLFERGPGRPRLTEAGQRLAGHAASLFAIERAAEEDLAALRGLQRGRLAIGASTTIATYFLPPILGEFHRCHPQVELSLVNANTREIVEHLRAHDLDVALVEGPVEAAEMEIRPWLADRLVPIAGARHPLALAGRAERRPLDPVRFMDAILILREPGSGTRDVVEAALDRAGLQPARRLEIGGTEAIKQAVAAGLGVAFVSAAAVADLVSLGRVALLNLDGLTVERRLTRLFLRGRQPSPAAAAFDRLLDRAAEEEAATQRLLGR